MTFEEWWGKASDSWQNAHFASYGYYRLAWEAATAAERERCAKVADEHLARIAGHHPDQPMADRLAQGYGNASLNIAAAIRAR